MRWKGEGVARTGREQRERFVVESVTMKARSW